MEKPQDKLVVVFGGLSISELVVVHWIVTERETNANWEGRPKKMQFERELPTRSVSGHPDRERISIPTPYLVVPRTACLPPCSSDRRFARGCPPRWA